MNLLDICEQDGPYWAAYQAERKRARIIDNPAMVPPWFLTKLARDRLAAARVALEQAPWESVRNAGEVHRALRTLEEFVGHGIVLDPDVELVVAGLLGAQEAETERERRDAEEVAR